MKDFNSFSHTSVGYSHIASKKPCQDYSVSFEDDIASVIVVSDGHGSNNFTRSDRGSKIACEVTLEAIKEFLQKLSLESLERERQRDEAVTQLCKYILLRWNSLVSEDAAANPFTENEVEKVSDKYKQCYLNGTAVEHAYGCTLIFVIITHDFCLAVRNGDGQCVAVSPSGEFSTPIPWNDDCEFNVTTSLCDDEAINNFRYFYSADLPVAVFAGSDGVDDSYTSTDELYNLYRSICLIALSQGIKEASDRVEQMLPEITKRGSTDDVSIAGIINLEALESARTAMEIALELHRIQVAKAQREGQLHSLRRKIEAAEKRKAKITVQLQDLRQKQNKAKLSSRNFFEHMFDATQSSRTSEETSDSVTEEERQLLDDVEKANKDIAEFKNELLALIGRQDSSGTAEPTSVQADCSEDVSQDEDSNCLLCDTETETKSASCDESALQAGSPEELLPCHVPEHFENGTTAPE